MNNSEQAQKGFKTFLLTLSVSLIIFSVIYYLLTNSISTTDLTADIDSDGRIGDSTETTVFGKLADQQVSARSRSVLAGADAGDTDTVVADTTTETTESTVPETGVVSITAGLLMSLATFLVGLVIVSKDPRKLALTSFEKNALKDLD